MSIGKSNQSNKWGVCCMDINTYLKNIEIISDGYLDINENIMNIDGPYPIDDNIISILMDMVKVKRQIITVNEIKTSNIINNKTINSLNVEAETKLIITAIYIEACSKAKEKKFLRSMGKYRCGQPIFKGNDLFNHVRSCRELINYDVLHWQKIGNICQYANKYFAVGGFVRDEILSFVRSECVNYIKFIRIEPYFCSDTMPPMYLREEALRPVNPSWINNLTLFKGGETGGHYILQNPIEIQNGLDGLKWWEYKILGIRSLEIYARRNNSGNLSMMIEEVSEKREYGGYHISRCIHLDSDNVVGTSIDNAILNHIDLAINVYNTGAYAKRKTQSLANGRVVDATLRTHLLRLENVPFRLLINLSSLFFESQSLIKEWITDQFENIKLEE